MDTTEDICVICQEGLSTAPTFEIPECRHSFHQSCINAWFRQGNSKCPLCNSCGVVGANGSLHRRGWSWSMAQFSSLRRASKRKDAPPKLVKGIAKIKKKEERIKKLNAELKSWKDKDIVLDGESMKIKDAVARYKKIQRKYRTQQWQLRRAKAKFAAMENITPIILVERRIID